MMERFFSKIQEKVKSFDGHIWFSILLFCSFTVDSFLRFLEEVVNRIPFISNISFLFTPFVFLVLSILSFRYIKSFIRYSDLLFVFLFLFLLGISSFIQPENSIFIVKNLGVIFFQAIPYYFLGLSTRVNTHFKNFFYYGSVFVIAINILYLVYYYASGRSFSADSMFESYSLLLPVLFVSLNMLEKPKWHNMLFSLLGTGFLFAMGTRGPIVIEVFFCGLFVSFLAKNNKKWLLFLSIVLVAVFVLWATNLYSPILTFIKQLFEKIGLSSRVFDFLLEGDGQESIDERNQIYLLLLQKLSLKPFLGYGLFGEYPLIFWSAHNMYLQTLFEFGVIGGPALILVFIILSLNAISKKVSKDSIGFSLIWISYIFIQGVFGGNIISFYVFFALGFFVQQYRYKILDSSHPVFVDHSIFQ